MLARFNEIIPNGADRIVAMAEAQQRHRHDLEATIVKGNAAAQSRAQWFAFLLAVLAIGGGIALVAFNKDTAGLTAIIVALATLGSVFFYGKVEQSRERARKREELREAETQPRLPLEDEDQVR
jgi:uncharacterized membrane protein